MYPLTCKKWERKTYEINHNTKENMQIHEESTLIKIQPKVVNKKQQVTQLRLYPKT